MKKISGAQRDRDLFAIIEAKWKSPDRMVTQLETDHLAYTPPEIADADPSEIHRSFREMRDAWGMETINQIKHVQFLKSLKEIGLPISIPRSPDEIWSDALSEYRRHDRISKEIFRTSGLFSGSGRTRADPWQPAEQTCVDS